MAVTKEVFRAMMREEKDARAKEVGLPSLAEFKAMSDNEQTAVILKTLLLIQTVDDVIDSLGGAPAKAHCETCHDEWPCSASKAGDSAHSKCACTE